MIAIVRPCSCPSNKSAPAGRAAAPPPLSSLSPPAASPPALPFEGAGPGVSAASCPIRDSADGARGAGESASSSSSSAAGASWPPLLTRAISRSTARASSTLPAAAVLSVDGEGRWDGA